MGQETSHPQEIDLDKTDRLPILEGTLFDEDVADDAVPMDRPAGEPPTRSFERARDAESASTARADALAADLAAARASLESEQVRSRATLAARDATIVQVLHSLAERDAQFMALQQEHAKIVPALEARSKAGTQMEAELQAARAQASRAALDLKASREQVAALAAQIKASESQTNAVRSELGAVKALANSYLELLRTREWRHGFDQNLYREFDAQVAALEAERVRVAAELAHLQEAHRPIQSFEGEVKRLTEQLAAKSAGYEEVGEENRNLRAALERTRSALQEREFLIRRLERSESNNANALGRIQTSMERPGASAAPAVAAEATHGAEWSAEFVRLDGAGGAVATHVLARRTRIGRAPGCELHIDSTSVSRQHALVLVGPRDCVIEDLNSTNGVIVNGRRVTRQVLCDGDTLAIGEVVFRYVARPVSRAAGQRPGDLEH